MTDGERRGDTDDLDVLAMDDPDDLAAATLGRLRAIEKSMAGDNGCGCATDVKICDCRGDVPHPVPLRHRRRRERVVRRMQQTKAPWE